MIDSVGNRQLCQLSKVNDNPTVYRCNAYHCAVRPPTH